MGILYCGQDRDFSVYNYRSDPMCMAVALKGQRGTSSQLTVNLGNHIGNGVKMPKYAAFVDTVGANKDRIMQFINEHQLAKPYEKDGKPVTLRFGLGNYPLYQFDREKLQALDPKGCAQYEQNWSKAYSIECIKDKADFCMKQNMAQDDTSHFDCF